MFACDPIQVTPSPLIAESRLSDPADLIVDNQKYHASETRELLLFMGSTLGTIPK